MIYEVDICNECLHKVVALTKGELADMGGEELYHGDEVRRMVDKEIADMRGEE